MGKDTQCGPEKICSSIETNTLLTIFLVGADHWDFGAVHKYSFHYLKTQRKLLCIAGNLLELNLFMFFYLLKIDIWGFNSIAIFLNVSYKCGKMFVFVKSGQWILRCLLLLALFYMLEIL